jgi:predicted DNA-binding transcriptional regulator AlpA
MIAAASEPPRDNPQPTTAEERLIGAGEFARRLGISRRTLATRLAAGQLPKPIRVNGRLLWSSQAVDAYICRLLQPDDDATLA